MEICNYVRANLFIPAGDDGLRVGSCGVAITVIVQ